MHTVSRDFLHEYMYAPEKDRTPLNDRLNHRYLIERLIDNTIHFFIRDSIPTEYIAMKKTRTIELLG